MGSILWKQEFQKPGCQQLLFAIRYWNHEFQCDRNCNLWKRERMKYIGECSLPTWICTPHIKTIQAGNIVIYSPRVQQCIRNDNTVLSYQYPSSSNLSCLKIDKNKWSINESILVSMFEMFVGLYKMKNFTLPRLCRGLGYIMMYNKWLNYFPIFSAWKAI